MEYLKPPSGSARGKVVLLVPRWSENGAGDVQGVPFRTFFLAWALLRGGYEVVIFDQELDLDLSGRWGDLVPHLREARAAFLWMNEMYPYHQTVNTLSLAERIRADAPGTPVAAGGEFLSVCPPRFLDFPCPVDFFVRGYGEGTCLELLDALEAGRDPTGIPGLAGRDGGGRFFANPPGKVPALDPGCLDLYRRIDLSGFIQRGGIFGNGEPTFIIGTGRGCLKGCRFCVWSGRPARLLPAEAVADLVRDLREKYGVKQYHVAELDFFTGPARVRRFARLMREKAPDCVWFALGSPSDLVRLEEDDWEELYAGGLRKVEIGIESGSEPLLRRLGKRHGPEECYELVRKMLHRGIVPMSNFLFGFPGETREDRRASLRLILRIWKLSPRWNVMTFRYFQPTWNTPLGEEAWAAFSDPPRTLPEYLEWRLDFGKPGRRSMPWLEERDEAEILELVGFHLPLATSKLSPSGFLRRGVYRVLRRRAEKRIRKLDFRGSWDRLVYRRLVGEPLDSTYVP